MAKKRQKNTNKRKSVKTATVEPTNKLRREPVADGKKMFRLGVFVREKESGRPLEGVPVAAIAETNIDNKHIPLGVLASDHVGYLSFDLSHLKDIDQYERILVYLEGNKNKAHIDAKSAILSNQDLALVSLDITRSLLDSQARSTLPSFQSLSVSDYRISPNSFALNPVARLGDGTCENLLPRNF
ncbi:MAG TPA: hypothetical protein VF884_14680, partial [Nitrososphaeraceae archaeon]